MAELRVIPPINVRGQLVALGPFLREHIRIYAGWLQDPEVAVHGNGTFRVRTPEEVEESFQHPKKNEVVFAIYALPDLALIGETVLMDIDHQHGTALFGITIGRKDYWGRGYGTEAARLVLDYGFRFLNLYNILLITLSYNTRAQRAYLKAGFREMGRRRGALLIAGRRYDDIYMECLAAEFTPPEPGWFTLP